MEKGSAAIYQGDLSYYDAKEEQLQLWSRCGSTSYTL